VVEMLQVEGLRVKVYVDPEDLVYTMACGGLNGKSRSSIFGRTKYVTYRLSRMDLQHLHMAMNLTNVTSITCLDI
jgi:hypothetical protein